MGPRVASAVESILAECCDTIIETPPEPPGHGDHRNAIIAGLLASWKSHHSTLLWTSMARIWRRPISSRSRGSRFQGTTGVL